MSNGNVGDGHVYNPKTQSFVENTPPASGRTIGPVTLATGGAVAVTTLLCYLVKTIFGVEIPPVEQGAITLVIVMVSGWLVKPRSSDGRHEA